jgi:hypothetical protein
MLLLLLRVCLHLCDPSAKRARGMRRQLKVSENHLLLAVACCSWLKHVGPVASLAVLKLKQTPPHKLWLDSESTVKYRALFEKAVRQRAACQQGSVVCWCKLVLKLKRPEPGWARVLIVDTCIEEAGTNITGRYYGFSSILG